MTDEHEQILSESQEITFTLNSAGWAILEQRANKMINELMDIRTLTGETTEDKMKEIEKRELGISLFTQLLQDLKGEQQFNNSENTLKSHTRDEYIINI